MTISQLIDELSNLGAVVGLDAEVKAWNLHEAMQPLEHRNVSGLCAGWDKDSNKPCATIRLSQP